jgi:hypothetical protein
MDVFGQNATLERSNMDRSSVELSGMANRRAQAESRDGNSRPFFEVAAEVSGYLPRDASVRSELKPPTATRKDL